MDKTLVILLTELARGGAETQAVHLAKALTGRGWRCRIVSLLPPRDFVDDLTGAGVDFVGLDMRGGADLPRVLRNLIRVLRKRRPQILLTMTYHANVLGKIAGRLAGAPVIVSSIRSEFFGGRRRDWLERLTGPLATMTTTNSATVAASLIARRVVTPAGIRVIPNAVSLQPAAADDRSDCRRALGISTGATLWLNVGRLVAAKDQAGLLRAFAAVRARDGYARLAIAGSGPLRADLEALADRLGLADSVLFLGLRRDIPLLLAAADFFVLSSAWEGTPNALLEAMAAGLPFVTTEVGGAGELARAAGGGLVVPPGDVCALGGAMLDLSRRNRDERNALGRAARRFVEQEHGSELIVEKWLELFAELAPGPRAPGGS